MDDKLSLRASRAGIRLIAQTTIYNSGDQQRLSEYIANNYTPMALEQQPLDARLQALQSDLDGIGRLRVRQVMATSDHYVIVLMESEQGEGFTYVDLRVEEDYPHLISAYNQRPLSS